MRLAALVNAAVRSGLAPAMRALGSFAARRLATQLTRYTGTQAGLREAYGVGPETPIRGYDAELRAAMQAVPGAVLAETSGSTQRPKQIAYTRARMQATKKSFAMVTLRTAAALGSRRPIVFTLASLADDQSFTTLMTRGAISRLDLWVTPHVALNHPDFTPLAGRYGVHALRLWALVLSNPGWLYSTNPSTQSAFFHALAGDWQRHTAFLRDFVADAGQFSAGVRAMARSIVAPGWKRRANAVLGAREALSAEDWLAIEVVISWDGGNNGPHVRQVRDWLPSARFVPMFSMSTETLETLTVWDAGQPKFLPIAPGVLYEFLPEHAPDDPALLLSPLDLAVAEAYVLVASDGHGLRRYMTEDVFECRGHHLGLPDLHFVRRRGLTWSFTGEKLTGAQVEAAWDRLAAGHPALAEVQATVIPTEPEDSRLPGYRIVLVAPSGHVPVDAPPAHEISQSWERALGAINEEYRHKRETDRLLPAVAEWVDYDELARTLRGALNEDATRGWDSQFKLLPLTCRRLESLKPAWKTVSA